MSEIYQKPFLRKLQTGLMNKFGTRYLSGVRPDIDGVSVDQLAEDHGSPLFVYSERKLRNNFRSFRTAFSSRYPNMEYTWSYKTNYLDAICAILHDEGETAEVVSGFEYSKARRLGIPGDRIIFNGPYKTMEDLEVAASEGASINIDHLDEIHDLEQVATKLGTKIRVGIRLNMDVGITPQWSRFGFNLDSGQALEAVKRIQLGGQLELCGLHCHIGTYILEPGAYGQQAEKMVHFAYQVDQDFGFKIDYLDLGGGFPSPARLKGTYLAPEFTAPPIDEYAEALCNGLLKNLRPGDFPKVILEAGRAVVDSSGYLISTVHTAKRLPDGKRAYVIDAGINLLFTSFWYRHTIELSKPVYGPSENCVIYGPMCMNIDVIDEVTPMPTLARGTRLVISPVGAYSNTQWMQFISFRPPVMLIGTGGEVETIREAEELEDIVSRERLPERLRPEGD